MTRQAEGPNHELFVKVLAQIEREPENWDQRMWATQRPCGTSYCFAGYACVLSGHEFRFEIEGGYGTVMPNGSITSAAIRGGRDVVALAAELLGIPVQGLTYDDEGLFVAGNTLDDLYRISADILGIDETVLRDKVAAEATS